MIPSAPSPIVHLELHTANLARACDLYVRLFGWRAERVEVGAQPYQVLEWGAGAIGGGVVECEISRARWLPYVEVAGIDEATERACRLGARVLLDAREGPAGWRSVIAAPDGGEVALWQPKRRW